jgi:hypothetical protein
MPQYEETTQPEEWMIFNNQVTDDQEILELCKLMLNPTINTDNVYTFDELIIKSSKVNF